jgi:predicted nucleotidyltransferase
VSHRPKNPNYEQLVVAARKLEPLLDQVVFVGGCVTGLLITDPGAAPVRNTLDVDAIIEIASYAEFTALAERLRHLGFRESLEEGAPICRWVHGDLVLDLMPIDPSILGFSNRWYLPAFQSAQRIHAEGRDIRVITAPYFLATKLEAFRRRGKGDYRASRDLEDIVAVIDGRSEVVAEVQIADPQVRRYLRDEFRALISDRDFLDALPGHLLPDAASQQRLGLVLERIRRLMIES